MIVNANQTDVTTYVVLVDSTAGTPETGLTITAIDATYTRAGATAVKNDLTALGSIDAAHGDNKGYQVDSTNAPGLYRIDWPDAAFATGVNQVVLSVTCSGCAPAHLLVDLGVAQGILNADLGVGTDSGSATVRTVRQALRMLRNKWTISAGTLTVYKENDSTTSWTASLGTTEGADPVTSSDPADV